MDKQHGGIWEEVRRPRPFCGIQKSAEYKKAREYLKARNTKKRGIQGDDKLWILKRNEILRAEWRQFLASANVSGRRKVSQDVARRDGRKQPDLRPSCLDPLTVGGQLAVATEAKAEALACYFARKSPTGEIVTKQNDDKVRARIRAKFHGGGRFLEPPI